MCSIVEVRINRSTTRNKRLFWISGSTGWCRLPLAGSKTIRRSLRTAISVICEARRVPKWASMSHSEWTSSGRSACSSLLAVDCQFWRYLASESHFAFSDVRNVVWKSNASQETEGDVTDRHCRCSSLKSKQVLSINICQWTKSWTYCHCDECKWMRKSSEHPIILNRNYVHLCINRSATFFL